MNSDALRPSGGVYSWVEIGPNEQDVDTISVFNFRVK